MIRFMMTTFLAGMGTGGSLIIAIGAQNAFVLTKGIQRHHHIASGLTCSLIDAVLIGAGVLGMGRLVEQIPLLLPVVTLGGALFLFIYGILSLYSAVRVQEGMRTRGEAQGGRKQVILTTLAISLLNPHVYLDTVVLLGSISTSYPPPENYIFALGAIFMSFIWFFALTLAGSILLPLFRKPVTWRILDTIIFVIMWSIAYRLLIYSDVLSLRLFTS